jgi:predicted nucleic acid-binding protein
VGKALNGRIIDTNVLIYPLAGALNDQAEAVFAESLKSGSRISIITRIELLGS